jgi:transposase-like protein
VHKIGNVLNYLPKALQPKAKQALAQIWMAETRADALVAFEQFVKTFGAKYPKAVECLLKDREALIAFFDFPAEHWIHIRSTNVIESTFATIRHRTDRTKGCLNRDGMLTMMFKLGMSAQQHWRRLRGFEWLAKMFDGVKFRDGVQVQAERRTARHQEASRVAA